MIVPAKLRFTQASIRPFKFGATSRPGAGAWVDGDNWNEHQPKSPRRGADAADGYPALLRQAVEARGPAATGSDATFDEAAGGALGRARPAPAAGPVASPGTAGYPPGTGKAQVP